MRVIRQAWVLTLWTAVGCGAPASTGGSAEPTTIEASAGSEATPTEAAITEPRPAPEPPPEITLELVIEDDAQRLSIQSRGATSANLAANVGIERLDPETERWVSIDESALTLPDGCGDAESACVELAPGGELRLRLPLLSDPALEACGCAACVVPGAYRIVVQSCGGQHRRISEPLTVP